MPITTDPDEVRKILVIQLGPFGDILLTTAYFEYLKNRYIGVEITYLIKKKYLAIVKDHPYVDRFMFLEKDNGLSYYLERIKMTIKIRKQKYDIVIDQQNLISTKIFTFFSKAAARIGYKNSRLDFVYNVKAERGPKRYNAAVRFDLIKPLGISPGPYQLVYKINQQSFKYVSDWIAKEKINRFFVISPGSPVNWKKWNIKLYAQAAAHIAKKSKLIAVWLWARSEKNDALEGIRLMGENSIMAPPTSLDQAAALLRNSELLICNDGGINHLAAAIGVKTIALFGATDPLDWSPAADFKTHHHLYNQENNSKKDNSFGITVEELVDLTIKVLDE